VSDEAQFKSALEFFAEHVDTTPRQLVVKMRNDEVESYGQFSLHRAAAAADLMTNIMRMLMM